MPRARSSVIVRLTRLIASRVAVLRLVWSAMVALVLFALTPGVQTMPALLPRTLCITALTAWLFRSVSIPAVRMTPPLTVARLSTLARGI